MRLILVITIISSLIFCGIIGGIYFYPNENEESDDEGTTLDDEQRELNFTALDGYDYALSVARQWNGDVYCCEICSEKAHDFTGNNSYWSYHFRSPSTAINITENVSYPKYILKESCIKVKRSGMVFNHSMFIRNATEHERDIGIDIFTNLTSMDSSEAATIASNTYIVTDSFNETDEIWIIYRLNRDGWSLNVDSMEYDAHLFGISILITIDVQTGEVFAGYDYPLA